MARVNRAEGAVALVTGANRGIGLGFVQELLARGAKKVYAGVRDPSTVSNEFDGLAVEVLELDVTDLASVDRARARCTDLTMLVNNAGYFANRRLVLTDDPQAARQEMEVNYFGVLNTTRAFAGILGANGGGAILNVLSVAGAFAAPFMGGYSSSKAAALTLSTITRAELKGQGTDVVSPDRGFGRYPHGLTRRRTQGVADRHRPRQSRRAQQGRDRLRYGLHGRGVASTLLQGSGALRAPNGQVARRRRPVHGPITVMGAGEVTRWLIP